MNLSFIQEKVMKSAIRTSVVALAAMGFVSAFAQQSDYVQDRRAAAANPQVVSTLTRAQVQAEAAQAQAEKRQRGYLDENDIYLRPSWMNKPVSTLSREAVRAEAIKASREKRMHENNS
jgi:Zn-dependent protease with chaperone function